MHKINGVRTCIVYNKMVSGRQRAACKWRRLGCDTKPGPHNGGGQVGTGFKAMTSKWFRFEETFIYAYMCYYFEN